MPRSPLALWSLVVTVTAPRASMRRVFCAPFGARSGVLGAAGVVAPAAWAGPTSLPQETTRLAATDGGCGMKQRQGRRKGGSFARVVNFKRSGLDLHRCVAILALSQFWRA